MSTDHDEAQAWNTRFAQPGFFFGTAPNAFLTRTIDLLAPGQSVLAVADGEGRNGVFLAERGMRKDPNLIGRDVETQLPELWYQVTGGVSSKSYG